MQFNNQTFRAYTSATKEIRNQKRPVETTKGANEKYGEGNNDQRKSDKSSRRQVKLLAPNKERRDYAVCEAQACFHIHNIASMCGMRAKVSLLGGFDREMRHAPSIRGEHAAAACFSRAGVGARGQTPGPRSDPDSGISQPSLPSPCSLSLPFHSLPPFSLKRIMHLCSLKECTISRERIRSLTRATKICSIPQMPDESRDAGCVAHH